jgi:PTS system cellobiose-specific IIB component
MQKAANAENYPAEVSFAPAAGFEDRLEGIKAVLAGPQIKHRFEEMKRICDEAKIPAQLIPTQIYGLVDGKKALELAKKMIAG